MNKEQDFLNLSRNGRLLAYLLSQLIEKKLKKEFVKHIESLA